MLLELLFVFSIGAFYGAMLVLKKVKNVDEGLYAELWEDFRTWYNKTLDGLKGKTKEDKIKELKDQITELETE